MSGTRGPPSIRRAASSCCATRTATGNGLPRPQGKCEVLVLLVAPLTPPSDGASTCHSGETVLRPPTSGRGWLIRRSLHGSSCARYTMACAPAELPTIVIRRRKFAANRTDLEHWETGGTHSFDTTKALPVSGITTAATRWRKLRLSVD